MELQLLLLAAIAAVVLAAFPFAVEQLLREIDRQRVCAAARTFGGIVATRFLTEPCTRCRGREMGLLAVGPQALWIRYQCRSCGQSQRADAASRSAGSREAEPPYRRYQAMRVRFNARYRGRGLRIDIVFRARAVAASARAVLRAPAPARMRRRGLRAARARASHARSHRREWL
jgi:hypothetical protein